MVKFAESFTQNKKFDRSISVMFLFLRWLH